MPCYWPDVTDCDRLDAVFSALSSKGIVTLQNAGYTQSDGHSDVAEAYHDHPHKDRLIGYCFYHGQDLERAVVGEGLYLAFGPMDASREASEGPSIGALIAEELRRGGLEVVWDGTFDQRIFVPRKRRVGMSLPYAEQARGPDHQHDGHDDEDPIVTPQKQFP